ncbi:hypothetical protein BH10PSE1_BH10PSE1_26620 [soil metagenome]
MSTATTAATLAATTAANVAINAATLAQAEPLLNLDAIAAQPQVLEPYQHVLVDDILAPGAAERLTADYPEIPVTGYIAMEEAALTPTFTALAEELRGHALTEALSQKFGRDFHQYPRLVTMRRWSQAKEGHIHTDSKRKVMTMLIYLNPTWDKDSSAGNLRVLYNDKGFEPYATEIPPLIGTMFAFTRSENSWHGHLPFTGERRVVQVTWLRDADALDRKVSNNKFHQKLKAFFTGKKASAEPMM